MIINKIVLNNFRQFSGRNEIDFSIDKDKNITVIHAMNGSGKTTLLQSFFWVLYGEVNLPNPNRLLNEYIFKCMNIRDKEDVSVELDLSHEGCTYNIIRRCNVIKSGENSMKADSKLMINYIDKNGKSEKIEDQIKAQNKINSIMPKKLAKYFFFDGERIEALGENNAKARKDISNGIKTILNIDTFDSLKRVLERDVIKLFTNDLTDNCDGKLDKLRNEMYELEKDIIILTSKKNELLDKKEKISFDIEEKEKIIKSNAEALALEKTREKNYITIKKYEEDVKQLLYPNKNSSKASMPKVYTQYITNILLTSLKEYLYMNLDIVGNNEERITGINSDAIDDILKREKCICGRKIGVTEIKVLENLKQYLPPHDQTALIFAFKSKYEEKLNGNDDIENEKDNIVQEYFNKVEEIQNLREEDSDIDKSINNIRTVTDINEQRNQLLQDRDEIIKEIGITENKIEETSKKISQYNADISETAKKSDFNHDLQKKIEFTARLARVLDINIERRKREIHQELEDEVNKIFKSVSHKKTKTIEIDEDYSYTIFDIDTSSDALSEGESVITSLSFIAAIIKIAKNNEENKRKEIGEGVEYPLVLDAPFAKLDSIHINGIAPILPKFADQVILFTVDQQFKGVTSDNLISNVGIEYEMKSLDDKEVKIMRVR